MNKEHFNNLPYFSRKEVIELRNFIKTILEENMNTIYETGSDNSLHKLKSKEGSFYFSIAIPNHNPTTNSTSYSIEYKPENLASNGLGRISGNLETVKSRVYMWLGYIKKLHQTTKEYYNPDNAFYEKEFENFFTNNDEDAAYVPYDLQRQDIIFYFFNYAQNKIENSSYIDEQKRSFLIQEIDSLKENIPKLTKKGFVSALSKLASDVKAASNKLFHEIFDVLKKEAIKTILNEGIAKTPQIVHNINQWLHHFQ